MFDKARDGGRKIYLSTFWVVETMLHVGWIWLLDLAGVTSEFNSLWPVTYTGMCVITDKSCGQMETEL
jgi:hypothetical protein